MLEIHHSGREPSICIFCLCVIACNICLDRSIPEIHIEYYYDLREGVRMSLSIGMHASVGERK